MEDELRAMLPLWSRITCPVRIVHAVDDRLVPFANAAFAERMLVGVTDLRTDTLGTGDHFILWNHRDRVTIALREMIAL